MNIESRGKILLYYNPYSGNGMFKNNLDMIIEECQARGFHVMPVRAQQGVRISKALENLDQNQYTRIMVAGGDGTVNICVNAMVKHDIHLPLAILPSGTANDFAYYFELPSDLGGLLDIALGEKTTKVDVGVVNNTNFINVTALGGMVDVSQKTDPNLKSALGPLAYYLQGARELVQLHPLPVTLTTPEAVYEEEIYFMTVLNGESAGGFRKLSPQSSMSDGKLDVVAFRKMPIVEFAPLLFEVISGRHPENKNVLYFQTESLRIESPEDISTDIDGEHGEKLPLEFSVLHHRLDVFVSKYTWKYDRK